MTALEEIKKALEEVTPERVERLWWFLHILAKSTGTTNAEDDKWNWINAFCTDYEDDTFNLAAKLGFITVRHDSFMETSTARIKKAGMALVAHFDKAPSAALTSTLESLQRENEELRQRLDVGPCGEDAIDVAESSAEHLRHRAEAAEAEVKRLRDQLDSAACLLETLSEDRPSGDVDATMMRVMAQRNRTALASRDGDTHKPVAYVCAADMELLGKSSDGWDFSMSPKPRPDLGMNMALYAAPLTETSKPDPVLWVSPVDLRAWQKAKAGEIWAWSENLEGECIPLYTALASTGGEHHAE